MKIQCPAVSRTGTVIRKNLSPDPSTLRKLARGRVAAPKLLVYSPYVRDRERLSDSPERYRFAEDADDLAVGVALLTRYAVQLRRLDRKRRECVFGDSTSSASGSHFPNSLLSVQSKYQHLMSSSQRAPSASTSLFLGRDKIDRFVARCYLGVSGTILTRVRILDSATGLGRWRDLSRRGSFHLDGGPVGGTPVTLGFDALLVSA